MKNTRFDEVDAIVQQYREKGRDKWSDEEIASARAELAALLYEISRNEGPDYYKAKADLEIEMFRREGIVREEAEKKHRDAGFSKSMAFDHARKAINTDKIYLSLWKESEKASSDLWLYKEWMTQGNQVLNSMAKKA